MYKPQECQVYVEVPCDLDVEAPCARRWRLLCEQIHALPDQTWNKLAHDQRSRWTSFLLWVSILKCALTVVCVLVILETLGSQRFSRILEETLDIISFMRVHCDTWHNSRGHHQIGVLLGNVIVQILFPKHLFTPRTQTPYGHIRTRFWKLWLFLPSWLPSAFVRQCQGPIGFCILDQLTIVCTLRGFGLKPHKTPIHGVLILSWIDTMRVSNTTQYTWEFRFEDFVSPNQSSALCKSCPAICSRIDMESPSNLLDTSH